MAKEVLTVVGLLWIIMIGSPNIARASPIDITLSWQGSNNYTMNGDFSYPDTLSGPITGAQLSSFVIFAYLNGSQVGSWNLADGFVGYNFNFNFNATTLAIAQGGLSYGPNGQDWDDASGGGSCPSNGIGFSSGSGSQLLCVNGSDVSGTAQGTFALETSAVPELTSGAMVGWVCLALFLRKSGARRC